LAPEIVSPLRSVERLGESFTLGDLPLSANTGGLVMEKLEAIYERVCGLDVHKKSVVACRRRITSSGRIEKEVATFGTTTSQVLALLGWLQEWDVTHVAMESTGVYVRRITARAISLAERTGSGGNPWVNDSPSGESQKGTTACRRSGAAQKPCMVRLCQTRVLG
jgi:hypothetical protein